MKIADQRPDIRVSSCISWWEGSEILHAPAARLGRSHRLDDIELVARIARDDHAAFEALMRRHNGKLFRVARAILRDEAEAEDALQDAYLDAYRHIGEFRGGFEPRDLAHSHRRQSRADAIEEAAPRPRSSFHSGTRKTARLGPTAETRWATRRPNHRRCAVLRSELRRLLERRIDDLPVAFRTVFVMREVEEMTRARRRPRALGHPLVDRADAPVPRARAAARVPGPRSSTMRPLDVFGFAGERCDRIVAAC